MGAASEHRQAIAALLDEAETVAREVLGPDCPTMPRAILRQPGGEAFALQTMLALMRAIVAGKSGGDAKAVFREHAPQVGA
jgi:hypothetical protein